MSWRLPPTVPRLVLFPLGQSEALVELNQMCEADHTGYKHRWVAGGENRLSKSYADTGIFKPVQWHLGGHKHTLNKWQTANPADNRGRKVQTLYGKAAPGRRPRKTCFPAELFPPSACLAGCFWETLVFRLKTLRLQRQAATQPKKRWLQVRTGHLAASLLPWKSETKPKTCPCSP